MIKNFNSWLNENLDRTLYNTYNEAMGDHLVKKFFEDLGYTDKDIIVIIDKDVNSRQGQRDDTISRYLMGLNRILNGATPVETKTWYEGGHIGEKREITIQFFRKPMDFVYCFFPNNKKAGYWFFFPFTELDKELKLPTLSKTYGL